MNEGCDRKMTWEQLAVENQHLKAELAVKDEAIKRARAYMDKECWLWMGDGNDHPESLTCPVVVSADQVRAWVGDRKLPRCEHGVVRCVACADRVVSITEVQGKPEDTIHFRGQFGGPKVRVPRPSVRDLCDPAFTPPDPEKRVPRPGEWCPCGVTNLPHLTNDHDAAMQASRPAEANEVPRPTFEEALRHLLNSHCKENDSNTPDFILANYIHRCLETWAITTRERERWYGSKHEPGRGCQCEGCPSAWQKKAKFRDDYVDGQLGQLGIGSKKKRSPTGCKKCNWTGSTPMPPKGMPPYMQEYLQEVPCRHCVPSDCCVRCGTRWGEVECCCSDVLINDKLFVQGYCTKCCDGRKHPKPTLETIGKEVKTESIEFPFEFGWTQKLYEAREKIPGMAAIDVLWKDTGRVIKSVVLPPGQIVNHSYIGECATQFAGEKVIRVRSVYVPEPRKEATVHLDAEKFVDDLSIPMEDEWRQELIEKIRARDKALIGATYRECPKCSCCWLQKPGDADAKQCSCCKAADELRKENRKLADALTTPSKDLDQDDRPNRLIHAAERMERPDALIRAAENWKTCGHEHGLVTQHCGLCLRFGIDAYVQDRVREALAAVAREPK